MLPCCLCYFPSLHPDTKAGHVALLFTFCWVPPWVPKENKASVGMKTNKDISLQHIQCYIFISHYYPVAAVKLIIKKEDVWQLQKVQHTPWKHPLHSKKGHAKEVGSHCWERYHPEEVGVSSSGHPKSPPKDSTGRKKVIYHTQSTRSYHFSLLVISTVPEAIDGVEQKKSIIFLC